MPGIRFTHDGESWDYDINHMTFNEAIELEKISGQTVEEWRTSLSKGGASALKACVWMARRKSGIKERFSDFDADMSTFESFLIDEHGDVIPNEPEEGESADPSLVAPTEV